MGVGRVDPVMAVVADLGVVFGIEAVTGVNGVKGTRPLGERSCLAEGNGGSGPTVLGFRRPTEPFRATCGSCSLWGGMTRGARSFGDRGCLNAAARESEDI
jgi:hypothetical protein